MTGHQPMKPASTLPRFFTLKPYGNELITPGTYVWIWAARVMILIMATVESLSWGYFGSYFMRGRERYFSGIVTAAIVFLVIWVVDVTLMSLDTSKLSYEMAVYKQNQPLKDLFPIRFKKIIAILVVFSKLFLEILKLFLSYMTRVGIAAGSLYFTAPFLIHLVFANDIQHLANVESSSVRQGVISSVASQRDTALKEIDSQINSQDNRCNDIAERIQMEISGAVGKGLTGHVGDGSATQELRKRLVECQESTGLLRNHRKSIEDDANAKLHFLFSASSTDIANRYGVTFPNDSYVQRDELVAKLRAKGVFKPAENTIRAFLAFIFSALLLLKILQPDSVSLYLSERLHDLYKQYLRGSFKERLRVDQRPSNGNAQMTPYEFKEWWLGDYLSHLRTQAEFEGLRKAKEVFQTQESVLRDHLVAVKSLLHESPP